MGVVEEPGAADVTGAAGVDRVLGIETSCDETAAAVVDGGRLVRSSVVSSQVDIHARYGGVVPEIAGRAHLELLGSVITDALAAAGVHSPPGGLDAVAATAGPGLVGSLLVGVSHAKALALAWDVPFVGVNHLEAHLFAPFLAAPDLRPPVMVLLVSGGHTLLVHLRAPGRYDIVGQTLDDAAGEAYDKVARYLGLGYPGGPALDRDAARGDPAAFRFPRALLDHGYDFSFSGLKTAVMRAIERDPGARTADVAASFQAAVAEVLVAKTVRAACAFEVGAICLAGGVAANSELRRSMVAAGDEVGIPVHVPAMDMCTDNAAMVAAAGWWHLVHEGPSPWSLGASPGAGLAPVG